MTETKTYPYIKYIPHLVAIRLIVLSPFAIAQATAEFISNSLDKLCHKIDKVLPEPYIEKQVEWDQLPKRNQQAIEQLAQKRNTTKERILIQTVKP
jgi:phosphohistidine phosphatase SixA